ncbi:MAG: chemotaxis protein CheA [Nitrospinae bacterium]|nr:chemotaxis protein CheA [Nitrospinota bacterium]
MSAAEPEDRLLHDFLEEAEDMVSMVEQNSARLEAKPEDLEPIHEIFRGVHSLKGMSSFFNLTHLKSFSHEFESFLDLVREKQIEVNQEIVHFILDGADHLKNIFNRLRAYGTDTELAANEQEYLESIDEKIGERSAERRYETLRVELLRYMNKVKDEGEFEEDSQAKEVFDIIGKIAPELVEDRRKSAITNGTRWIRAGQDISREYMALKSLIADAMADKPVENGYKIFMENVESLVSISSASGDGEAVAMLEEMKENFEMFFQDEIGMDSMLAGMISEGLGKYAADIQEEKPAAPSKPSAPGARPETAPGGEAAKVKTVRVRESLLDEFLDQMGELITINELFNNIQRKLDGGEFDGLSVDMKSNNQAFRELSGQMQKSLYEVRKAPVERGLSKLPSIVRGIAKETGKQMRLIMTGGDTEVDKSLLDKIENILIHCVRNSADHGLEPPEARIAGGKPAEGTIRIDVHSDGSNLYIAIYDDGRGVDVAVVKRKAVEKGMLSIDAAAKLPETESLNLLLRPGFSTAEEVTETSGRGVGMDVLMASVAGMGGSLKMANTPGRGLRIDFSLPLAYATRIKLGLTLGVGASAFLIPAENVRESFKASKEDVSTVEGKGEVVSRWGMLYPVIRLAELFGVKARKTTVWDSICVLAESKGQAVCLVVDEMIGQRQIVYKQLTVKTREPNAFEGISILDGRNMALILSVEGIIKQFREQA